VLLGTEDDLWEGLNTGAQGVISALANFMPEEIVEMRRKVEAGDEAGGKALSEKLQKARAMTKEYAFRRGLEEASRGPPRNPDGDRTPALRARPRRLRPAAGPRCLLVCKSVTANEEDSAACGQLLPHYRMSRHRTSPIVGKDPIAVVPPAIVVVPGHRSSGGCYRHQRRKHRDNGLNASQ
jgi:hypothetical protein